MYEYMQEDCEMAANSNLLKSMYVEVNEAVNNLNIFFFNIRSSKFIGTYVTFDLYFPTAHPFKRPTPLPSRNARLSCTPRP